MLFLMKSQEPNESGTKPDYYFCPATELFSCLDSPIFAGISPETDCNLNQWNHNWSIWASDENSPENLLLTSNGLAIDFALTSCNSLKWLVVSDQWILLHWFNILKLSNGIRKLIGELVLVNIYEERTELIGKCCNFLTTCIACV